MDIEPELLEREAHSFLSDKNFEEAFRLFKKAAQAYSLKKNHKQSTLCFASAGTSWNKVFGERTFYNAASSYGNAAREAEKYGDFEYASLLYKHAAINHEKDMEFLDFSDCFYRSKECYRKFLAYRLIKPNKIHSIARTWEGKGIGGFIKRIFLWFMLTFSFIIWGHGERPERTFFTGIFIVFLSGFFYTFGYVVKNGIVFLPNIKEAFYFSMVTFTTLGYGDITPIGFTRFIATIESFSGLFIVPLFIVGLSRKYLRIKGRQQEDKR